MKMHHYCTYFDHRYIPRGLALYDSLTRHCPSFTLWVLCLDDECRRVMSHLTLQNVRLISLGDLERAYPELVRVKPTRSRVEYIFTSTPSLPLYIFESCPDADAITYVDSDLYFFADPQPLFDEMGNASVAIVAHRFPPSLKANERYGIYNVGYLTFRRNDEGLACLQWWQERCFEWCYDRVEDGRFADQKYLDDWPERFPDVVVLTHKGVNIAPWNVGDLAVGSSDGQVLVDGASLICYHFHGLKRVKGPVYDSGMSWYGTRPSTQLIHHVYRQYLRDLTAAGRTVAPLLQAPPEVGSERTKESVAPMNVRLSTALAGGPEYLVRKVAKRIRENVYSAVERRYMLIVSGVVVPLG